MDRAGLHLGVTTVRRMMKDWPRRRPRRSTRRTAGLPPHDDAQRAVWHVDVTIVPSAGRWTPWLPFFAAAHLALCWHVAITVDHYSRRIMDSEAFKGQPTSRQTAR